MHPLFETQGSLKPPLLSKYTMAVFSDIRTHRGMFHRVLIESVFAQMFKTRLQRENSHRNQKSREGLLVATRSVSWVYRESVTIAGETSKVVTARWTLWPVEGVSAKRK